VIDREPADGDVTIGIRRDSRRSRVARADVRVLHLHSMGVADSHRSSAADGADLSGLVWTLIRTDFKTRYHGTLGGYMWALFKPMTMFMVLLGVFSLIFSMDPDYPINLVIGLFVWDFFAEATRSGMGCLHAKSFLLTKAKFPRWILVLTSSSNAIITVSLFVVAVVGYLAVFRRPLSPIELALFLLYLLLFLMIIVGFSLAASVLYLCYRDLNQVWDLALQAGFFIAPIIYPLDILPEKYHIYLYLWPPTPVIQFIRMVLVQRQIPTLRANLLLVASALAALVVGIWVYRRFVPRAVEEL
jgi:lipopolysaccharide transport system permease protein